MGAAVAALEYWRLRGGQTGGEISNAGKDDPKALAGDALLGLMELIERFDDPATPYHARPRPENAPAYSDYQHLARVREWMADTGGEG
jgi:ATP-dependent helicase/nuclease subunit B